MKPNFFMQMLSGPGGAISSKRGVMIFLLFLFAFCVVFNLFTGKAPNPTYIDQVFEALLICLGTVFGEKVIDMLPKIRQKSSTSTTVISPDTPTVTTVTNSSEPVIKS